ncbi:GNAT family N-acetyltransferase [Agrococcus casei]
MAVLASPAHRGAGFAYATAAVATQEALGIGLVAQWRSRQGNEASRRLAQRLGFTQLGVQVAVTLKR